MRSLLKSGPGWPAGSALRLVPFLLPLGLLVAAGSDSAASRPCTPPDPAAAVVRAETLFEAGDTRRALSCLEPFLDAPAPPYEVLWRGASLAVALGVEVEAAGDARGTGWYDRAEGWAAAAVERRPEGIEGRYWTMAVLGRRALGAGPRDASALSDRILRMGTSILSDAPNHAPTHNALGRLHLEIMSSSGVTRFFGRALLGGDALKEASWENARHHLERAVALDPEPSMHHLDLARYFLARGDEDEARVALEEAIARAGSNPPERVFAREARDLLDGLGA